MEFKIDAKDNYTLIAPKSVLIDANLADILSDKCKSLFEYGSNNFIIDLAECQTANAEGIASLINITAAMYDEARTFVLTNLSPKLLQQIKNADAIDSLNYAPTFMEAVDVVNMEILERDLFNEE